MAYEKRENSGSAFKNRKKIEESHADYTGDCLIDGQEYWINTWVKKDKNGNPWFSHSFRKKQPRSEGQVLEQKPRTEIVIDDDLPFN